MPAATDYSIVSMIDVKTALSLKETNDDEERLLAMIISGISQEIETITNRPIIARLSTSEAFDGDGSDTFWLPPPLIEVSSLINDGTTIASTDYWVYRKSGMVKLRYSLFVNAPQSVVVTYRAGWEPNEVPADLRKAALMWVAATWMKFKRDRLDVASISRGDESVSYIQGIPPEVLDVLQSYRLSGYGA